MAAVGGRRSPRPWGEGEGEEALEGVEGLEGESPFGAEAASLEEGAPGG